MTPAKILLVDDHQSMRGDLRSWLHGRPKFRVVGDACDANAAWLAVDRLDPDVVILDLELPDAIGMPIARRLRRNRPDIRVVILTKPTGCTS
jgi:two-component system response regulator DevR